MTARLKTYYHTHHTFLLIILLFINFRALTLLAYRPGGLVLDFSDFYFYRVFAQMDRLGYVPYDNLWTTYPPLFPWLMINIWRISEILPPWEFDNLWFTLLLGGVFLLFEIGNLWLLYLMSLKIYPLPQATKPVWIYACLFTPVYTLTGWFENYPLFFFLLGLYLLLQNKPYSSAVVSGVGFMIKLIPLLLLLLGVKLLPVKRSYWPLQISWLNIDLDLRRVGLYLALFSGTIIFIGYPFYRLNPDLIFSPFYMTSLRPAWQTIWALLDGNYEYGIIPLDMRNLDWSSVPAVESRLPWVWITLVFGFVYILIYTRRLDWQSPKVALAFTGLTICFFLLYSKGYSPQWLVWLLVFIVLLLPNARGVIYAIILQSLNLIEANLYFIIFSPETWLLVATILIRTGLILVIGLEFCLLMWPYWLNPNIIRTRRLILGTALSLLLLSLYPATSRLYDAYFDIRLQNSPYRHSITWLQEQPVKEAILLNNQTTYDWYYPYLRHSHRFFMLDDYANETLEQRTRETLEEIKTVHKAMWIFDTHPEDTMPAEHILVTWLKTSQLAHQADIDGGRLYLYIFPE